MGRQIPIMMNQQDEECFIEFLRSKSEIAIFEAFAPNAKQLKVEEFSKERYGHWFYDIWNQDFRWKPQYLKVGSDAHDPEMIGWSYISNKSSAPILEVSRSCVESGKPGRLYWARDFAAARPLRYGEDDFSRWIDEIWRWVRKTGQKQKKGFGEPYVFPGAQVDLGSSK